MPRFQDIQPLLSAFLNVDIANRALVSKVAAALYQGTPECSHPNVFWFPEQGPILMDHTKVKEVLVHMPSLLLCSDCEYVVNTAGPHSRVAQ